MATSPILVLSSPLAHSAQSKSPSAFKLPTSSRRSISSNVSEPDYSMTMSALRPSKSQPSAVPESARTSLDVHLANQRPSSTRNGDADSDLDLDDFSPLPPSCATADAIPRSQPGSRRMPPPLQTSTVSVEQSPAPSQAPSSLHLDGSPSASPSFLGQPRAQSPEPHFDLDESDDEDDDDPELETAINKPRSNQRANFGVGSTPAARVVTVSAILSRSEMYYPRDSEEWDMLRIRPAAEHDAAGETAYLSGDLQAAERSRYSLRRRPQRKRPSNGSAIEALGALLLRKDSSGRVASLSFEQDDKNGKPTSSRPGMKPSLRSWSSALNLLAKRGVEIRLPLREAASAAVAGTSRASGTGNNGAAKEPNLLNGGTIAERRALMWKRITTLQGAVVENGQDGFSKVKSRREGLSFEVASKRHKQHPATLLDLDNYRAASATASSISNVATATTTEHQHSHRSHAHLAATTMPGKIVLKAGSRPKLRAASISDFGIGSSYHNHELPEAPPSPVAMPGAWHGGSSWRSKPGDGYDEGALLLPPPLLDDQGSDPHSFEGLLGVRRMREQERARKRAENLAARNRPTHKVGPLTALSNFVMAAHAAEGAVRRAQKQRNTARQGRPSFLFRSRTAPQVAQATREAREEAGADAALLAAMEGDIADQVDADAVQNLVKTSLDATSEVRPNGSISTNADRADDDTVEADRTPDAQKNAAEMHFEAEAIHRSPHAISATSPFLSSMRRAVLSRRGSRANSTEVAGRQLNTLFEFETFDPSKIPDDELNSPDLPPISSPLLRPTSRGSIHGAIRDLPRAPRLLPVQLSVPPSPFTPLGFDVRTGGKDPRASIPGSPAAHDYLSARTINTAPRTPQLVPTMLSLPPSPWTPYQDSASSPLPMLHLQLNTSSSSLRLPPGTPRLIPTHLEIMPSPFPVSASSRRGSLTREGGPLAAAGARIVEGIRSPPSKGAQTHAMENVVTAAGIPHSNSNERPGSETPTQVDQVRGRKSAKCATSKTTIKPSSLGQVPKSGSFRLTPASMLATVVTEEANGETLAKTADGPEDQLDPLLQTFGSDATGPRPRSLSRSRTHTRSRRRSSVTQTAVHIDSSGRQRSFLLWFLVGDLGLRSRGRTENGNDSGSINEADYGGLAVLATHIFGLILFIAAHAIDVAYQAYEKVSLLLWFLRWMLLNLTGQTVLAQCAVEAYRFIQAEWTTVAMEDHEDRGSKRKLDREGHLQPRGLSRWQVMRGLLELYCLHSVTRERYLAEGAGLKLLGGWERKSAGTNEAAATGSLETGRLDIGAHRAASRSALRQSLRASERSKGASTHGLANSWPGFADTPLDYDPQALPNKHIAEDEAGTPKRDRLNCYDDAYDNEEADDDNDHGDDDDDSSDEEMIVTNRGDDILEFAKTPRLDAQRPGQDRKNSGYFGRAYDFMTSPQVCAASDVTGGVARRRHLPRESNRALIRTIKWCGRLAISAYGLHVHIVDLPPTFTPSGERFSRQTFAYLSRLNADDVLHADIQTLDADADYSPTFYIVRDYVRKVVCVAVRGTQSFSDIIVDLDMQTEEIELPQVQPMPGEEFRCHAGIWRAAKALVSPQSKLFATLRQALEENEGFGIMFCGHSLGGAIASAAALLLAEYFIPEAAEPEAGAWVTNMSSGLPARRPIRAVSFASPVTMTADLASRAALGSVPLVTTVVLGSDLIPRAGHGQVRELRRVLGALSRVRRRHALTSEGQEDARVHILRSFWDWRAICRAEDADDVMLHRKERIEEQLWSLRREVESDLYAAVKGRHEADVSCGIRMPPSPWVGPEQRSQAPLHQLAARRQALDTATLRSEAAQGGPLVPPGRCIWINEKQVYHVQSPLAFFSLPELRADMFAMHFPAAYEEAILSLKT
ncbi:hypothetical protein BCV70DRAFT_202808 [Testicularia cyperi]|uniref:sn-1-specific diacylglycerol lipase n=1 Tax=Testicularia cyperi TaxID=1882483 RepID=A0A317XGM0_9BASI|nr:hypothetical protein BCV70DRAFT_202808 [Testicularia cyperi]